jgi:spermidine synthase
MEAKDPEQPHVTPEWFDYLLWLSLAAFASLVLLGTTSQITQEIAVIPFLWVAPLAIYLLTFILTFESERWYHRGIFAGIAGVLAPLACVTVSVSVALPVGIQLLIYLAALFAICMLCHGELAFTRPAPRYLTTFYLTIAAGGALGGVFAALVAPRLFTGFSEYWIGLAGACVLGLASWLRAGAWSEWTGANFAVRLPLMALIFGAATSIVATANSTRPGILHVRNFYGTLHVSERKDSNGRLRELTHGRVQHGLQYMEDDKRSRPTTYYGPHSGVALAIDAFEHPRHVAVIGLGTGTLAAWSRKGDDFRFYEINPNVETIARQWFSFLKDAEGATSVVLGDARVQMERELASGQSHDFNVIAVDAFSGDAIPTHLLTTEAGDLYRQRLAPGGMIALHISNRSLNLEPVARGLARHLGWQARMVVVAADLLDDNRNGESGSRWVLLAEKRETFTNSKVRDTMLGWSNSRDPVIVWTDDYSSLWPILKLR